MAKATQIQPSDTELVDSGQQDVEDGFQRVQHRSTPLQPMHVPMIVSSPFQILDQVNEQGELVEQPVEPPDLTALP